MFRSILVPLDGSPFAEAALPWALALARRADANLELIRGHVLYAMTATACGWLPYDPSCETACWQEEQLYLNSTAKWLATVSPVPIICAVVHGQEADDLLEHMKGCSADLVVMATHGRGPVSRFFSGSVANEVVRRAGVPVLLVRPRGPAPALIPEPVADRILVPLDGSALAEQALAPALDLAHLLEGSCCLLRVVEPSGISRALAMSAPDRAGKAEEEARAYLARVAQRVRDQGIPVQTHVVVALHAAEAILEQARTLGSELIALATHGRGGVGRVLLGSIADKVIQAAPIPVLVYHPAMN